MARWKKITLAVIAILVVVEAVDLYFLWKRLGKPTTYEKIAYKFGAHWDWIKIRLYYDGFYFGAPNPQAELAPKYFQIYLQKRPSSIANEAATQAFRMWGNLPNYKAVDEAAKHVPFDAAFWGPIAHAMSNSRWRASRLSDASTKQKSKEVKIRSELISKYEELQAKLTNNESRSSVLYDLADLQVATKQKDKARKIYQEIVAYTQSDWFKERAKQNIYELDSLNIGQSAPNFSVKTLSGNSVSNNDFKGKYLLVYFWSTTCGPCIGELPNINKLYKKIKGSSVSILGVATSEKDEVLDAMEEHGIVWPQTVQPGWDGEISKAFNLNKVPSNYMLGPDGKIVFKDLRGEELEKRVEGLLEI